MGSTRVRGGTALRGCCPRWLLGARLRPGAELPSEAPPAPPPLAFGRPLDDSVTTAESVQSHSGGSSARARGVVDKFDFNPQIPRLDRANLLYLVIAKFADIDLHPEAVSNIEMGYIYEELIR